MREELNDRAELRALRRRAYRELNLAIDQSGGELPSHWLLEGDRDLESLRKLREPDWQLLVRRQTGRASSTDPQFPGSAWGDPHRRRNEWFGVSLILVVLAVAVLLAFMPVDALRVLAALAVSIAAVLIWSLPRRRVLVLGGIVLIAGVIVASTLVPEWLVVAAMLLLASAGAYVMAQRAGAAAKGADDRSIALRKLRTPTDASAEDTIPTRVEHDEERPKPTDPEPPLLS
jgi:hypothetical protein